MSCLPTPPSTSHREKDRNRGKENISPKPCKRQRVVEWSDDPEIHLFFSSHSGEPDLKLTRRDSKSFQSVKAPTKGILKPARALQPYTPEVKREVTPQPDNILANSQYLVWPISTLVKDEKEVNLKDFTEAWSVLTARIRCCIGTSQTEKSNELAPLSYPILRPLQQNAEKLTGAVVRDLKRVLIDPLGDNFSYEEEKMRETEIKVEDEDADVSKLSGLLSPPKDSPKKRGMSAEQVKYSRDLCVLCHSVIKFLLVAFATPMIYNIFTHEQIHDIFTAHLNILLEPNLPTSNARKTYAIAMTLIQMQRLPSECLAKETSRITLAIRRGLEGKLGREGKKGPGSDGLRAIHDLSINHPVIFVPTLAYILPSILANLSSPSAPIRVTSAHALGGFAYALVSSEDLFVEDKLKEVQASTSKTIYDYFIGSQASSPISSMSLASRSSPNYKTENDTWITKTLKVVLSTYDPPSNASSPIWGLSVLSSFIILLGPLLLKDYKALRLVTSLIQSALKYKKGSVRALGCRVVSLLVFGWIKYDPKNAVDEDDSDMEESKKPKSCREMYFRIIRSTLDGGNAIALLGALLGPSSISCSAWQLKRTLSIVDALTTRGGPSSGLGMEIIQHLLSSPSNTSNEVDYQTFIESLLPQSLFSVSPGLLTTEWANITPAIKNALENFPKYTDVRSMDINEVTVNWVWKGLLKCWKDSLTVLEIDDDEETPSVIMDVWQKLVSIKAHSLEGDGDGLQLFAKDCASVLAEIIKDDSIDLRGSPTSNYATVSTSVTDSKPIATSTQKTASKYTIKARKLAIVRDLWSVVPATFTSERCYPAIAELLAFLAENEKDLVPREDIRPQGNTPHSVACIEWTRLTAVVLKCGVSTGDDILTFWNGLNIDAENDASESKAGWEWSEEQRSLVWRAFSKSWREEDGSWEGTYATLGLPFLDNHPWNMSDADVAEWEAMLQYCIVKGLDIGLTSFYALDIVARSIERRHLQTLSSAVRIADLLLSQIDFSEADPSTEYPAALIDVVHDILDVSYPPEPRNKIMSFWLIRSVTAFIDNIDPNWLVNALDAMQKGLCAWMQDECHMLNTDEYSINIVPLYQTILVSLHSINPNESLLETLSPIITAPFYTAGIGHAETLNAFQEFWKTSCLEISQPVQGWPEDLASALMIANIQTSVQVSNGVDEVDVFFRDVDEDKGYDADVSISDTSQDIEEENLIDLLETEAEGYSIEYETAIPSIPKFEPIPEGGFTRHNVRPSLSPIIFQSKSTENNTSKLSCTSINDFSCQGGYMIPSTPKLPVSSSPFKHVQSSSLKRKRSQTSSMQKLSAASTSASKKEKENEDPLSISTASPLAHKITRKSVKRIILSDSDSSPGNKPLKKRKINQATMDLIKVSIDLPEESSSDSEDIRMVEESLFVKITEKTRNETVVDSYDDTNNLGQLPSLLGHIARTSTKQNSNNELKAGQWRMFMDAVEVPTLRQFEKARLANIHSSSQASWTVASENKRINFGKMADVSPMHTRSFNSFHNKKGKEVYEPSTKVQSNRDTVNNDDELLFDSDDSFFHCSNNAKMDTNPTYSEEEVEMTSITPHHILTPPMRHAVQLPYKPISRDPASSSPIRARVARRLSKTFSAVTPADAIFSVSPAPDPILEII